MQAEKVSKVHLSEQTVSLDDPRAWKRLGLIALATDLTSERDFARIVPHERAGVYVSRIAFENPVTPETLGELASRLTTAAGLLLPGEQLDAVCFSCTAASVVIGDEDVAAAIHAAHPGVPVVTPTFAARFALAALGARRITVLTPYLVKTSEPMAAYFAQHGFDVTRFECLGLEDDREMARVSRPTLVEAACRVMETDAEALFISCTALPSAAVIADIEALTGKPVVTSNQASIWAMMRHAGLDDRPEGFGRLFGHDLPLPDEGVAA